MALLRSGDDGVIVLSGDLDFDAVASLWPQLAARIQAHAGATLSLSLRDVGAANSAALALLLEAQQLARQQRMQLTIEALPQGVLDLAQLSNAVDLIGGRPPDPA